MMMDCGEHAGLGLLQYDVDPQFHVVVGLNPLHCRRPFRRSPMWEMDDGIIEGALSNSIRQRSQRRHSTRSRRQRR